MKKNNRFLISFNLIVAAVICNWGIIFYSIHTFDWFLILFPLIPAALIIVAVLYMPREDVVNKNDFKSSVVGRSELYTCKCKVCGKPFENNEDYYMHYDEEHN